MDKSNFAPCGMVVTPHHLATQSALAVLRDGGTAMEATVAAAATIAVVYPHMNGIGGDSFWLIIPPHSDPVAIEACGSAGSLATIDFYEGESKIPYKGPKAAITVPGTIGGWKEALAYSSECGYKQKSISKLLADAIRYAEEGYPMTLSQELATKLAQSNASKNFAEVFIPDGKVPTVGERFCQPQLANTLKKLVADGFDSFYKGELAQSMISEMNELGIPITAEDLANYHTVRRTPLRLLHEYGELYNLPPPTQGIVSLTILGILDKMHIDGKHEGQFIHSTVEATKLAFGLRDQYITDPVYMKVYAQSLLSSQVPALASKVNLDKANDFGECKGPGDTIWLGVTDRRGFSVSFIQSLYHPFGSEVVLPKTGVLLHNRGVAFSLEKDSLLELRPGKKPYHTLNPAAARLHDGRIMVYGTRGGDGQPQTQAAIFHRYVVQKMNLQQAVTAPRWLYGRDWSDHNDTLKLEGRFKKETIEYLRNRGHKLEILPEYVSLMGYAGAIVRHANGMLEGAFDPRSNGSAAGY